MQAVAHAAPARARAQRTHVTAAGRRPHPVAHTAPTPGGAARCACGGSCPRCQSREAPLDVLSSPGQALASPARPFFERRFGGEDFGRVRIHTDPAAAHSARALGAAAYTAGQHIVFGASRYQPQSASGQWLLAHELAHTLQQRGASQPAAPVPADRDSAADGPPAPRDRFEREASLMASSVLDGGRVRRQASGLDRQRVQLASDKDIAVEQWTRVVEGDMVPVAGVEGQTFTRGNCFNNPGCSVSFQFEQARLGTHPMRERAASPASWRGAYVKIVARPLGDCGVCDTLELLQILRYVKADASGDVTTDHPDEAWRRERAGSDERLARSKGWMIDTGEAEKSPFYSRTWYGEAGDATRPAVLWDAPGNFTSERNVGKEFETYLVCVGGGRRVPLGFIHWGYFIDGNQQIAFRPMPPKAWCGPSEKLFDAAKRWDEIDGNEPVGIDMGRPPAGQPATPAPSNADPQAPVPTAAPAQPQADVSETRGVFKISGSQSFIDTVTRDLDFIKQTSAGAGLIAAITQKVTGWTYVTYTRIEEESACGFRPKDFGVGPTGGVISYNTASCFPNNACSSGDPNWNDVPSHVGLFHELVHAYIYYVLGRGSDDDRECMATGLGKHFTQMPFNENRFRCELNLPIRPCYGRQCPTYAAPASCTAGSPGPAPPTGAE